MFRKAVLSLAALGAIGAATLGGVGIAQASPAQAPPQPAHGILLASDGSAQIVTGNIGDCVAVTIPNTTRLVGVKGTLDLFAGPNCQGSPKPVSSDQNDLTSQGLGHTMHVGIGSVL